MAETDPRLLRLVSRRFDDLAGLRTALIGILMMAVSGMWLTTRNGGATLLGLLVLLLLAVYPPTRGRTADTNSSSLPPAPAPPF